MNKSVVIFGIATVAAIVTVVVVKNNAKAMGPSPAERIAMTVNYQ